MITSKKYHFEWNFFDLSMALIYITCKDLKEANKISMLLLEKRLIACANLFPIKSMYLWKGKIENQNEFAIIAKTLEKKYIKIKAEVSKLHSYKIPCILKIDAEANEAYDNWVNDELN